MTASRSAVAFLVLFVALSRLYRDMIKQPETRAAAGQFGAHCWCGALRERRTIEALAQERERLASRIHHAGTSEARKDE